MYQKFANTLEPVSTIKNDAQVVALFLRLQLQKILRPYGKELKTYLERAEYPETFAPSTAARDTLQAKQLFTDLEIATFLVSAEMMPLQKAVILTRLMNRSLVVCIDGPRSAQIPLHYSDDPEALVSELWLNIYGLLTMLDQGFDLKGPSGGFPEEIEPATSSLTDCTSIEAVLQAARYHGFRIRLSVRRAQV